MDRLGHALGMNNRFDVTTVKNSEDDFKDHYVGFSNEKIGFSKTPENGEEFKKLYNTLDYYTFINVDPLDTPDNNFNYGDKILGQIKKKPELCLCYKEIDFEELLDAKELAKYINSLYYEIKNKNNKSVVFTSSDPYKYAAFIFGCYLSFVFPEKDEYDIYKAINGLDRKDKDILLPNFVTKETSALLTDFIHANNVRYKNKIDEELKNKAKKDEILKKISFYFEKELNDSIDKIVESFDLHTQSI